MKILGIIPARFESTRFPGKVLADINGKSMIQRVYEQVSKSRLLDKIVIATENNKVAEHAKSFGAEVMITSPSHASGTDRCAEVLVLQNEPFDYVINIQGDEPFIAPSQIDELAEILDGSAELATLIKKIKTSDELFNLGEVKTVFNNKMEALYFSRQPIPYYRNAAELDWLQNHHYYKHIGIYGYRADVLQKIAELPVSDLEKAESLEQLRWIENGLTIKLATTEHESICIDTREDLEKVVSNINKYLTSP